jgi:pimeloyl-ACP methyl ester carboxylesterase
LLHAAGVASPYLLVGHSVGGFNMRAFAAHYASEVAGVVLVDSADEYEDPRRLPKSMQPGTSLPGPLRFLFAQCVRLAFHAGLMRLLDDGVTNSDGRLTAQDAIVIHMLQLQPKEFDATLNEGMVRSESLAQVIAVRSLGDIPLIVLSGARKPSVNLSPADGEKLDRFMDYRVHVTQTHLATLSTKGRQIILTQSATNLAPRMATAAH